MQLQSQVHSRYVLNKLGSNRTIGHMATPTSGGQRWRTRKTSSHFQKSCCVCNRNQPSVWSTVHMPVRKLEKTAHTQAIQHVNYKHLQTRSQTLGKSSPHSSLMGTKLVSSTLSQLQSLHTVQNHPTSTHTWPNK